MIKKFNEHEYPSGWNTQSKSLYRKFQFEDFKECFSFMKKVAALSEKYNHHPKWCNQWNVLEIWLKTHDSNTITEKDINLAKNINKILQSR